MMTGFTVQRARDGGVLGTAHFDGTGWTFTSPTVQNMVEPKLAQGWSAAQVLALYDGWSNGAVTTTPTT